jgi:hypothetical protein
MKASSIFLFTMNDQLVEPGLRSLNWHRRLGFLLFNKTKLTTTVMPVTKILELIIKPDQKLSSE